MDGADFSDKGSEACITDRTIIESRWEADSAFVFLDEHEPYGTTFPHYRSARVDLQSNHAAFLA
jgi:hypothetical protein